MFVTPNNLLGSEAAVSLAADLPQELVLFEPLALSLRNQEPLRHSSPVPNCWGPERRIMPGQGCVGEHENTFH